MKKRTLSILLSLQMLAGATAFAFQPGITISARSSQGNTIMEKAKGEYVSRSKQNLSVNEEDEKIASLFQSISLLSADSQLHPENTLTNEAKMAQYNAELADLGVAEIDSESVQHLISHDVKALSSTSVICPKSTKKIKWWTKTKTVTYKGVKYNVQLVFAQDLKGKSNLAFGDDTTITLYKNKIFSLNTLKKLAGIYAQKTVTTIFEKSVKTLVPIMNWAPHELLFPKKESKNVTCNKHLLSYRGSQTVCFGYAAKASKPKEQELVLVTNSLSVASTQIFSGYQDEKPYSKSFNYEFTIDGDGFGKATKVAEIAFNISDSKPASFHPETDLITKIGMEIPNAKKNKKNKMKKISVGDIFTPIFPAQVIEK